MAPVTISAIEAVEAAVRVLSGATGAASITMQHVNGGELWSAHAHAVGASMRGQGSSLADALRDLRIVREAA